MVICFSIPKERRRRKNGWTLPLHPLQIMAWFFIVMFAVLYFGILVPSLPQGPWQISAYVINAVVFLVHIIIHLISVSLDPADISVRAKDSPGPLPSFDRKKHSHVIENQFCHICKVKVGSRSKHCSACNKCVSEFDHHCKWLNNCVGGRNYRLFLSCITSALLGCILIFILALALVTAYFDSASWFYSSLYEDLSVNEVSLPAVTNVTNNSNENSYASTPYNILATSALPSNHSTVGYCFMAFVPVNKLVWLSIVICSAMLSFLAIALLGHLLGFHIFLMCQNFSTYDYIVQKRDNDNAISSSYNKNRSEPGSKFIRLPFRVLQQMKTKKSNQITPGGKGEKSSDMEEVELRSNPRRRSSDGKNPMLPVVTNKEAISEEEKKEKLENYVGNVYIGSPHRRRHYLEPLHVRSKSASPEQEEISEKAVIENTDAQTLTEVHTIENDKEDNLSSDSDSIKETPQGHSYNHGLSRRHIRSPSPAPLLSPILESEISTGSAIVSWKHRSVSEQSLHMLTEDEEEEASHTSANAGENGQQDSISNLSRENSGSLSNLFMSAKEQTEVVIEHNNNDCSQSASDIEEDNRVHEVHIIPQGSFNGFKDSYLTNDNAKNEECSDDPFINGELWAYAPRNGCRHPTGVMSFRRSCSMQDECVNNMLHGHLTRCRSEDEIKSGQRVIRLQRRFSEDQSSWVIQDSDPKLAKKLKERSPKSGISATAVFCVEELDDPYSIPNTIPSGKRKYTHFAVPNHMVLPCSNSIHPESRKRTRGVGSKPPKAFHA